MKFSVGDASVQIVTMPGHTPGTMSFLFEVKDNGKPLRVAYVGGTAIPFDGNAGYYDTYIASVKKMAKAAADFGATALMSNHTEFDNALSTRPTRPPIGSPARRIRSTSARPPSAATSPWWKTARPPRSCAPVQAVDWRLSRCFSERRGGACSRLHQWRFSSLLWRSPTTHTQPNSTPPSPSN